MKTGLLLLSLLPAFAAGAADPKDAARPDPAEPRAPVPAAVYRSAFEDYRPLGEEKPAPWRESNDAVKKKPAANPSPQDGHGGHR